MTRGMTSSSPRPWPIFSTSSRDISSLYHARVSSMAPSAHACPPSRHGLPQPRVTGAAGAVRAHGRVSAWRLR